MQKLVPLIVKFFHHPISLCLHLTHLPTPHLSSKTLNKFHHFHIFRSLYLTTSYFLFIITITQPLEKRSDTFSEYSRVVLIVISSLPYQPRQILSVKGAIDHAHSLCPIISVKNLLRVITRFPFLLNNSNFRDSTVTDKVGRAKTSHNGQRNISRQASGDHPGSSDT